MYRPCTGRPVTWDRESPADPPYRRAEPGTAAPRAVGRLEAPGLRVSGWSARADPRTVREPEPGNGPVLDESAWTGPTTGPLPLPPMTDGTYRWR